VFVAVDRARDNAVVGFYTLSAYTITVDSLPQDLARKLPAYRAIPASLIGRLARAESVRGLGVGQMLVADAFDKVLAARESLAIYAVVVDAKNERATEFYRGLDFEVFPDSPRRLFLLTSKVRAAREVYQKPTSR
jgi:GNAT superfamily N-acetyltransferase